MAKRYVLFWFDVEDTTVPQSDDAAKTVAQILTRHGVRGTMKVVGHKARVLRDHIRYDVIDALADHAIGYHSNWHGLRPQIAEYLAPLGWEEGIAEFDRREAPGLDDLRALWDIDVPVCYGQPGSNWAAQPFPALRRWGIQTYVSGFGYVGLHSQPFWYGGLLCTSHMYGTDAQGRSVQHMFGLNFELGTPGALEEHQRLFAASYGTLEDGGLMSIMNHPCTLVLREWFSTAMKTPEEIAAGAKHFDTFIQHVIAQPEVETVTADQLLDLYPDRARERVFSREELLELARGASEAVRYQMLAEMAVSAAELVGMLVEVLYRALTGDPAPGAVCRHLDGPANSPGESASGIAVAGEDFGLSLRDVRAHLRRLGRLPDAIRVGQALVAPEDYAAALARVCAGYLDDGRLPAEVSFTPTPNLNLEYVDERAAESACRSAMMRPGFSAPRLLEHARLQSWTLKPALLVSS